MRASESLFLRACRGASVPRIPVWLMRQAGRYLPAYQALKTRASFWELCSRPELAAQATLDAARILDTDAAIIFSDITLPGAAMGLKLDFAPGPRFADPVRTTADVQRLRTVTPEQDLGYVLEAIRLVRRELAPHIALIGFVGAPLTLAAYMVEGDPGKHWVETKRLLYGAPELATSLLDKVTDAVVAHARAQVAAGCDAIQLFDTNAGELAPDELRRFAFASAKRVIEALRPSGVPILYFARGIGARLGEAAELGAEVLGLDWTMSIGEARAAVGTRVALMGNLDPGVLFTSRAEVDRRVRQILDEAHGHPGFIFNLGHGVLPETPPENARQVIDSVRTWSAEHLGPG